MIFEANLYVLYTAYVLRRLANPKFNPTTKRICKKSCAYFCLSFHKDTTSIYNINGIKINIFHEILYIKCKTIEWFLLSNPKIWRDLRKKTN